MGRRVHSLLQALVLLLSVVQFSNTELDLSNLGDQIQQGFNNLHLDDAISNLNISGRIQGYVEDKIQGVVDSVSDTVEDTVIKPVNDLKDKIDCAKDNLLNLDPEAAARCNELNSSGTNCNMMGVNIVVLVVTLVGLMLWNTV